MNDKIDLPSAGYRHPDGEFWSARPDRRGIWTCCVYEGGIVARMYAATRCPKCGVDSQHSIYDCEISRGSEHTP